MKHKSKIEVEITNDEFGIVEKPIKELKKKQVKPIKELKKKQVKPIKQKLSKKVEKVIKTQRRMIEVIKKLENKYDTKIRTMKQFIVNNYNTNADEINDCIEDLHKRIKELEDPRKLDLTPPKKLRKAKLT